MELLSDSKGQGPALVMMPGGLTGWLSWIPHAEVLSEARQVIRLQLHSVRAANDDEPLPLNYSPATEKAALQHTLGALDLEPPVDFVGWSYGAAVTLDFALDHPDWCRSLTLIEPPAFWALPTFEPDDDFGPRLNAENITEDDLAAFLAAAGLLPPGQSARDLPQWSMWSEHRQSLRANPSILDYKGDRTRLATFEKPVLLVKGTGSTSTMHRVIDELARHLSKSEVAEWPGGHAPHIVSFEPFLDRLKTFLAGAG